MTYDLAPTTKIENYEFAFSGYQRISTYLTEQIVNQLNKKADVTIAIECYPGVDTDDLKQQLVDKLPVDQSYFADDYAMTPASLNQKVADTVTDDRVLGVMSHYQVADFYPDIKTVCADITTGSGVTVVYGTGATVLASNPDILIYCDLARWEIQLRYRAGMPNWQQDNADEDPLRKFKRGYFFEWRMADRLKRQLLPKADYLLDTNDKSEPKLITGKDLLASLKVLTKQPYRTVPYFDASVWGGQWMKQHFNLPDNGQNYGWAFDGVPEENSLYFQYGKVRIEVPAMDLMLTNPESILGDRVFARFGAEFPIRFDYLDTMSGGNLSLQVHPMTEYIKDKYGMAYTQDESYYILDAKSDSSVYLGLKDGIDHKQLATDFFKSAAGEIKFPDEKYVNHLPAKKHDHFLIPAGTIHCGGSDTVVLEISATPYIFTFKMWDWGRIGLDGKPRPLHVDEGLENLQYNRTTDWVQKNLVNQFTPLTTNSHERVERTGLHATLEFIDTNRHWIKDEALLKTQGSVNMLNLVEGEEAMIESTTGDFAPFHVNYGETFIVPSGVKTYQIRNLHPENGEIGVLQAFVKE